MQKLSLALLMSLFVFGCAHHRDVRPGAEGVHRVVVLSEDSEEGARDALSQANHFCEKRGGLKAAIVDENKKYTGDFDEQTYKTGKAASRAAKVVGGTTHVLGGRRERNAGGVVALGGIAGDAVLGKGYTIEMRFKCQ